MTVGSSQNNGFLSIKITAMEKKSVMEFSYLDGRSRENDERVSCTQPKKIQEVSGEEKIGRNGGDRGRLRERYFYGDAMVVGIG